MHPFHFCCTTTILIFCIPLTISWYLYIFFLSCFLLECKFDEGGNSVLFTTVSPRPRILYLVKMFLKWWYDDFFRYTKVQRIFQQQTCIIKTVEVFQAERKCCQMKIWIYTKEWRNGNYMDNTLFPYYLKLFRNN